MSNEIPRRKLLRTGAAATAGFGVVGTAGASENGTVEVEGQIPCVDLTGVEDRTTTISSVSEPVPESATGIRPGSQMIITIEDAGTFGCSANFVWEDTSTVIGDGDEVDGPERYPLYIGAAGHCFLAGGKNATENARREGEEDDDLQPADRVSEVRLCKDCTFGGATGLSVIDGETYELGDVVYARQNLPDGTQVGHDFGLVRIPENLRPAVDPSIPQFGGPVGVEDGAVPQGQPVCQFGAGVGNGETFATQATRGVSEGEIVTEDRDGDDVTDAWYAGIRASPGDSGSLLAEYEATRATDAAGVLTHLTTIGVAGTTVTRCINMPKVDGTGIKNDDGGVVLAPDDGTDEMQDGGDTTADLRVVRGDGDVTP
jgi:hypothetical protein